MENRLVWVDYAKAIGIILVVYGHVQSGLFHAGIKISNSFYFLSDSIIYSFHMPLFFFLAGLFFHQSLLKRGSKQLILNKFDCIFYPYVIWSLIQGFIEYYLSKYTNGNLSFSEVLGLLWAPRAQFWFLYALFFIFIFSIIIYSIIPSKYKKYNFYNILYLIIATALYLCPSILPDFTLFIFLRNNLIFFALGIVFYSYKLTPFLSYTWTLIITTVLFILGQWFFHIYLSLNYTEKGIMSLTIAIISILFIVSLSINFSKFCYRYLTYIGSASMIIYLLHIIVESGVRIIMQKLLGINNFLLHIFIGCISGILIPLIVLKISIKLKIKYLFVAPISELLINTYNTISDRITEKLN